MKCQFAGFFSFLIGGWLEIDETLREQFTQCVRGKGVGIYLFKIKFLAVDDRKSPVCNRNYASIC